MGEDVCERLDMIPLDLSRLLKKSALEGYALSIKHRKRIEEAFGWAKTIGGMAQTVYRGIERVRSRFILTMGSPDTPAAPPSPAPPPAAPSGPPHLRGTEPHAAPRRTPRRGS